MNEVREKGMRSNWKTAMPILVLAASVALPPGGFAEEMRTAYYVGEKVCRGCHRGEEHGNTFSRWRASAHAKAYTALGMPEAKEIAEISGVDVEPQKSPMCLGCHTTAITAEDWELGKDFRRTDGVQCEACHGAGSEYIPAEIMMDPEKAMMAGLMMPDCNGCLNCHREKGTHTAILKTRKFDCMTAMKKISHPSKVQIPSTPRETELTRPYYTGVQGCAMCHSGPMMGYQFSMWRRSKHARAYAVLGLEKAKKVAGELGMRGDPQENPKCLRCHVTAFEESCAKLGPQFEMEDGVQCEACHGPGSEYSAEAIMLDPRASMQQGLVMPDEKSCIECHNEDSPTYKEPFDFSEMWPMIAHPTKPMEETRATEYKTPFGLAITRDGRVLCVACEESNSLILLDTKKQIVIAEIEIEYQPHDVCLAPDDAFAYVTNRGSDTLSVIDVKTKKVLKTIPVGDEPHGVVTNSSGSRIYVANAGTCDISVIDGQSLEEMRRLPASRNTWHGALSPDGKQVWFTNGLPLLGEFRTPAVSEVTVIDAERGSIVDRHMLHETNLLQGIAFVPNRDFALVTLLRTKNLVPMIRIQQGWTITNGLGIVRSDGTTDQVLLDEVNSYFADPTDLAVTPDGRFAYVTAGGIDAVGVVDVEALVALLESANDYERKEVIPNHLGKSVEYVLKRIPVGRSPRGVIASPDNRYVYVADGLDDTVSVIDVSLQERVGVISLEGPTEITKARIGSQVFHSSEICYQHQFSCHSCHPDGHVDGMTYDIEPDGIGINPVDNRTLRGIFDTAPFKWEGTNPSLSRQCGPRLNVFFTRIDPFTPEQLAALDHYITTIPRPPNRYRELGEDLTLAQRRGRTIFERTHDNLGRPIPEENRCNFCHSGPYCTNCQVFDVETGSWLDTHSEFDVPHLNNIYDSSPYLHDGRSHTLEEIWTRFNPNDRHGVTNDMTKDQLNDLIEYIKTL
jgi:YVTN family beta-propeller protein